MRTFLSIIMIIFFGSCFLPKESNDRFYIPKDLSKCDSDIYKNVDSDIIIDRFMRKILRGHSLKEISRWRRAKQISFFNEVYSQGCIRANYEHPDGNYYIFPYDAICEAFNDFKSNHRILNTEYKEDVLINIQLSEGLGCRLEAEKQLLIIEEDDKTCSYYYCEKENAIGKKDTLLNGKLSNWDVIKDKLFNDFQIESIPSNEENVNYVIRSDACYYYSFGILNNGSYEHFQYRNLYDDCGPNAELVKSLIQELEDKFKISLSYSI